MVAYRPEPKQLLGLFVYVVARRKPAAVRMALALLRPPACHCVVVHDQAHFLLLGPIGPIGEDSADRKKILSIDSLVCRLHEELIDIRRSG